MPDRQHGHTEHSSQCNPFRTRGIDPLSREPGPALLSTLLLPHFRTAGHHTTGTCSSTFSPVLHRARRAGGRRRPPRPPPPQGQGKTRTRSLGQPSPSRRARQTDGPPRLRPQSAPPQGASRARRHQEKETARGRRAAAVATGKSHRQCASAAPRVPPLATPRHTQTAVGGSQAGLLLQACEHPGPSRRCQAQRLAEVAAGSQRGPPLRLRPRHGVVQRDHHGRPPAATTASRLHPATRARQPMRLASPWPCRCRYRRMTPPLRHLRRRHPHHRRCCPPRPLERHPPHPWPPADGAA